MNKNDLKKCDFSFQRKYTLLRIRYENEVDEIIVKLGIFYFNQSEKELFMNYKSRFFTLKSENAHFAFNKFELVQLFA